MKTKKEFTARYEELKAQVADLEKQYETSRNIWRVSGYKDNEAYKEMITAERKMDQAKRDCEFYKMLSNDQPIYANQYFYTDVEPWEVVEIKTDRLLIVRPMKAELKKDAEKALREFFIFCGFIGHFNNDAQEWEYTSDTTAGTTEISRHKDGTFRLAGDHGTCFYIAEAPRKYYDYNF